MKIAPALGARRARPCAIAHKERLERSQQRIRTAVQLLFEAQQCISDDDPDSAERYLHQAVRAMRPKWRLLD